MHVHLATEEILCLSLNAGNWGSIFKKYSTKFGNCSMSLTKTLSRLIHCEEQCFSRCCVILEIFSSTGQVLEKEMKVCGHLIKINDLTQLFHQFSKWIIGCVKGKCSQANEGCFIILLKIIN